MLVEADRQQSWLRKFHRIAADAHRLPIKDGSAQLVFSNLMLEWSHDPDAVFQEIRRVLQPGGLLTFATLGPDTLRELRDGWRKIDAHPHVHRFIDMHDLGDALMRAGLAEPVMDTERLTVTYPHLDALLQELTAMGSSNSDPWPVARTDPAKASSNPCDRPSDRRRNRPHYRSRWKWSTVMPGLASCVPAPMPGGSADSGEQCDSIEALSF